MGILKSAAEKRYQQVPMLLAALLLSVFFIPSMITEGMFFDGFIYSSISRNLAFGEGSLFALKYTSTLGNPFTEHPPVFFCIQAPFFMLLGDTYLTEKIFCVVFLVTNSLLFCILVRMVVFQLFKAEKEYISITSILFLTICFPVYTWTYRNNLLEILLSTFVICSVLFYVRSLLARTRSSAGLYILLSVLSLILAIGVKGAVGAFPLAVPFLVCFFIKKEDFPGKYLNALLFVLVFAAGIMSLYWLIQNIPSLRLYVNTYFHHQVVSSLQGNRDAVSRFTIITELLTNMVIPFALFLAGWLFYRKHNQKYAAEGLFKIGYFFLFIGLCGILPIMVSPKQRGFYMVPGLPFIAAGIYFLLFKYYIPVFLKLAEDKAYRVVKVLMCLSFLVPLIYFFFPGNSKNKQLISELKKLDEKHHGAVLCVSSVDQQNWKLHAYLQRYCYISITDSCRNDYRISGYLSLQEHPVYQLQVTGIGKRSAVQILDSLNNTAEVLQGKNNL